MTLYVDIVGILEEVWNDTSFEKYGEIMFLLDILQLFDFIFMWYMMIEILGFTYDLNVALQKRNTDFLNLLSLANVTKQ